MTINKTKTELIKELALLRNAYDQDTDLLSILDSTPVATFVIGTDLNARYWNSACEKITGVKREEVINCPIDSRMFYPGKRRPILAEMVLTENTQHTRNLYKDKGLEHHRVIPDALSATDTLVLGGQNRVIHFTATRIHDKTGTCIGAIETFQDITEQKTAEQKVEQTQLALRSRIKELTCLFSISELAESAIDSVDPLIQGIVDLLQEAMPDPPNSCARIQFYTKVYESVDSFDSSNAYSADLLLGQKSVGTVTVFLRDNIDGSADAKLGTNEQQLVNAVARHAANLIDRTLTKQQLQVEQQDVERKNIALHEILEGVKRQESELGRQIVINVDNIIYPIIKALRQETTGRQLKYIDLLEKSLSGLTSPFVDKLKREGSTLTPKEIRICNSIRFGMSTKEIALVEHISVATVSKHRENIRRKLGITNKQQNLTAYLADFTFE